MELPIPYVVVVMIIMWQLLVNSENDASIKQMIEKVSIPLPVLFFPYSPSTYAETFRHFTSWQSQNIALCLASSLKHTQPYSDSGAV